MFYAEPGAETLAASYNPWLVIVSVAVAVVASYTAIQLAGRIIAAKRYGQITWLIGGAITFGIGIWAMHFIGMLAVQLPVVVDYDLVRVLVSILPAILASALAFFLTSRAQFGSWNLVGGSLLMGLGIAAMHYLGMAAMTAPLTMDYDPILFSLSILIAIGVSGVGLFLIFQLREEQTAQTKWKKILAALVMGGAISTMHYLGMAAAHFKAIPGTVLAAAPLPSDNVTPLAATVILGSLIILALALITALFDRRLSAQVIYVQVVEESQRYLQEILQGIQVGVLVIGSEAQLQLCNQAMLDLLQLSQESELHNLWHSSVTPETASSLPPPAEEPRSPSLEALFRQIAASAPISNAIVQLTSESDPESRSLLVNAVPLTLSETSAAQMVCTFNDVTNLKRTENCLKASETQFRELAQQAELFNQVAGQIRQSLDLQTILQTAVCEVRSFFETDRALVYRFDSDWRGKVILEDVVDPWSPTIGEAADDCFPESYLQEYRYQSFYR